MRKRVYKRGPSEDYVLKKAAEKTKKEIESVPLENLLFKGFLPAEGFMTNLGFRGVKLDSLWARNLLDSFSKDDEELALIAMDSSLADLTVTVDGGEFCTPYSMGPFAFYTEDQFENHREFLMNNERKLNEHTFISNRDWSDIQTVYDRVAHFSFPRFKTVCRGDSFAAFAVRENAYKVAKLLLDRGVDPFTYNSKGDDLIAVLKGQYGILSAQYSALQIKKTGIEEQLPSEVQRLQDEEQEIINVYTSMKVFSSQLHKMLLQIQNESEQDVLFVKQATLRKIVSMPVFWLA